MKLLTAVLLTIASMGVGESTRTAAAHSGPTATSPSASTAAEVPYNCKRFPPRHRRWLRYGYSICMNGPGWQRVRVRFFHPQAGKVFFGYGSWVRSHQVNPNNDLSIVWGPPGYYARGVRIQRIPEVNKSEAS